MSKEPTLYLIIDTSHDHADEDDYCDLALIPLTPSYMNDLLQYRTLVSFLHRADQLIYNLECWDATPLYFRDNERLQNLKDIHGQPAGDMPWGEPILLNQNPEIPDKDFQCVECQTVQIGPDKIWWVGYVKHTDIRVETAHIKYQVLEKVQKRFSHRGNSVAKDKPSGSVKPGILETTDQECQSESRKEQGHV